MRSEENQECGELKPREERALKRKETWAGPRDAEEPWKMSWNLTNCWLGRQCLWRATRGRCSVVMSVEP